MKGPAVDIQAVFGTPADLELRAMLRRLRSGARNAAEGKAPLRVGELTVQTVRGVGYRFRRP